VVINPLTCFSAELMSVEMVVDLRQLVPAGVGVVVAAATSEQPDWTTVFAAVTNEDCAVYCYNVYMLCLRIRVLLVLY
jgi:hypothetical protein